MRETIHVVQPFDRQKGGLIPRMAAQRATGQEAASLAQRLAGNHAGVIAYAQQQLPPSIAQIAFSAYGIED